MRFEVELGKRIEEEIEREREVLAAGMLKDMTEYKYHVGRIAGLNSVLKEYFGEVQTKINQDR